MLAEVNEADVVAQPVAHECFGRMRDHDLAAVRRGRNPSRPVHRRAVIVTSTTSA